MPVFLKETTRASDLDREVDDEVTGHREPVHSQDLAQTVYHLGCEILVLHRVQVRKLEVLDARACLESALHVEVHELLLELVGGLLHHLILATVSLFAYDSLLDCRSLLFVSNQVVPKLFPQLE